MFSLVIGELVKPWYHLTPDGAGMTMFLLLALLFVILAGFHLWNLTIKGEPERKMSAIEV